MWRITDMSLAYKFYDSVIGEIVNKTRLSSKKLARSNQNSKNTKYLYMTEESGEKIKDFIDLDNKRQEQIIQDAQCHYQNDQSNIELVGAVASLHKASKHRDHRLVRNDE